MRSDFSLKTPRTVTVVVQVCNCPKTKQAFKAILAVGLRKVCCCSEKKMNASKLSEVPPYQGGKCESFHVFFVCCHPIFSGRQTTPFGIICGRTSQGHTGGRPHGFPSSLVRSNFVYPRHNRSPLLVGNDVRDNPSSCDCAEIRTQVPTSEGFEVTKH